MLSIENLTKTYGGKRAVDSLSLSVRPGEVYGFIGHNGAGKTTTIRCVTGVMRFDSGKVSVCGVDVAADPVKAKASMAYIPDNADLFTYVTGRQFTSFICDMYGVAKDERASRLARYADAFEMTKSLDLLIAGYSLGMKRKIALIAALCHSPKLLILDEPFSGLDPKASFTLKAIMRELCEGGASVFFSTHVLEVAEKLCGRVGIINGGRLVAEGKTEKLLSGGKTLEDLFFEVTESREG